ncbi:MAG: hypothetical protein ACM3WQ_07045 [Chloroflexota bacterium]
MIHPQSDKIKDLNWSLSEFDRIIEVILSNLNTIREETGGKSGKKELVLKDYYDILNFKIEATYSLFLKLEELFFDTTFAFYKKYHGSVRGELSLVEFESIKREASYIFDSFLSQYKSLLDLTIKFVAEFSLIDLQDYSQKKVPDSFEKMLSVLIEGDKSRFRNYEFLKKSGQLPYLERILKNIVKEKPFWEEVKDYRDYTTHHGYVRHKLTGKSTEGQVTFSYWIPRLIKKDKAYEIDAESNLRLDYFCREKLYVLLTLIAEITDLIYDESYKQPYLDRIDSFPKELIKEVLLKISKKDFMADKIVNENGLKEVLKSKGIDSSELIEDFIYSDLDDVKKRRKKPNLFASVEKVFYKPIGNIHVFRTRFLVNKTANKEESRIKRIDEPSYGISFRDLSVADFVSRDAKLADVLDTLHRAGLVHIVKTKKGEIRYASVRDDLKLLVFSLSELSNFKWSHIQVPEMKYFRKRTSQENDNTRRILGVRAEEYLKNEDAEKEEIQKEYKKWKKQSVHYFENTINITDKDKNVLLRITHEEFVEEKKLGFKNWKQNLRIQHWDKNGSINSSLVPFFTTNEWIKNGLKDS